MNTGNSGNTGMAVLGGGITGLATAFFASKAGLPVTVFEKDGRLGGNCITFRRGEFSFDSGAHRIHDKYTDVTDLAVELLHDDLLTIDIPSQVFDTGHLLKFPFSLRNLLFHLGPIKTFRGGLEILFENIAIPQKQSFEHSARRRYGRTVADRFLLNYTEKLWGISCDRLSPELTGGRLKGLDMRRLMAEILGLHPRRRDMEGVFLYPRHGIGMLSDSLVNGSENARFQTNTEITAVYHESRHITGIRTSAGEEIPLKYCVSTIPLPRLLHVLEPPAPYSVISASESLRYRDLLLVALLIDKPSITQAATVYFPSRDFPFTRVAEPRNRSVAMSPEGKSSLVVEIPHHQGDDWGRTDDTSIPERIIDVLEDIGWIRSSRVLDTAVESLHHAYPVISLEAKQALGLIEEYISGFTNLRIIGRTGAFRYSWIHDHIADAHASVAGIVRDRDWFE